MQLFDDITRTYTGCASHAEPHFDYYNRSARPNIAAIRNVLEQWFADYPDTAKVDVRARFRKSDDGSYYGAFTELYCHAYSRGLGFEPRVHMHIEGKRQPDFGLLQDSKFFAYLECTVATEFWQGKATSARMNAIYDALNRLDSPDFFIGTDIISYPTKSMSAVRMRHFLSEKLKGLDPDVVGPAMQQSLSIRESPYYWIWEEDGFSLGFYPIPKADEARGRPDIRPMGAFFTPAAAVDDRKTILDALERKATRYGVLNAPYIIAINALEDGVGTFDIMAALFGERQLIINKRTLQKSEGRAPNGLWQRKHGPIHTRVSAVLLLHDTGPWNIVKKNPVLWHNPWAAYPIAVNDWLGYQSIPNHQTTKMESRDGCPAHKVFDLPEECSTSTHFSDTGSKKTLTTEFGFRLDGRS